MELEINVVDAFTDAVFSGNPAAVIITDSWLPDDLMQNIAAENNLSETAFLVPGEASGYQIRWFSPITEIPFCGHATLASAFVLFSKNPEAKSLNLSAAAVGDFTVTRTDAGAIQMNFPNTKPEKVDTIPESLLSGLSIRPHEVYRNAQAYFAVYKSEADVRSVLRDNDKLIELKPHDVVVTCQSESNDYDFVSRYFWPANGGDEDPVTGSIHTGLAPFWAERLGKNDLVAYQASQRGGVLNCKIRDNRVLISGTAVQYLKGQITV